MVKREAWRSIEPCESRGGHAACSRLLSSPPLNLLLRGIARTLRSTLPQQYIDREKACWYSNASCAPAAGGTTGGARPPTEGDQNSEGSTTLILLPGSITAGKMRQKSRCVHMPIATTHARTIVLLLLHQHDVAPMPRDLRSIDAMEGGLIMHVSCGGSSSLLK
jgi:hypothetical protein